MNKQQKAELVSSLHKTLKGSNATFLVRYRGLSVEQMQKLRGKLRGSEGSFRVSKVRLLRRALDGIEGSNELDGFLQDQIGVALAFGEAPAVAKVLHDFAKEHDALQVVAGLMDAVVLDVTAVRKIATLPSRDVLIAQVCGGIKAPLQGLTTTLYTSYARLAWVLRQAVAQGK